MGATHTNRLAGETSPYLDRPIQEPPGWCCSIGELSGGDEPPAAPRVGPGGGVQGDGPKDAATSWRTHGEHAHGVSHLLAALDFNLEPPLSVVIAARKAGGGLKPLLAALDGVFCPNKVVSLADHDNPEAARLLPGIEGKNMVAGRPIAYVCQNSRCLKPVQRPEALVELLKIADSRNAQGGKA